MWEKKAVRNICIFYRFIKKYLNNVQGGSAQQFVPSMILPWLMLPILSELIQRILYLYRFVCKKNQASGFLKKTDCRMPRLPLIPSWRILFWDPRYLQDPTTSQTILHPSGHYPVELAQLQCLQQCDRIRNQTVQCWHTLLGPQVGISFQLNT